MFWRKDNSPLPAELQPLFAAVMRAHHLSAFRGNASTVALQLAAGGSEDLPKAMIAALSTLGGLHAPIEATVYLLRAGAPADVARSLMKKGRKIPGWGSNLTTGPDDLWLDVDRLLREVAPAIARKIDEVTKVLQEAGKDILPNPSAYTAAAAIAFGMEAKVAPFLLISGRCGAWAAIFRDTLEQTKKKKPKG